MTRVVFMGTPDFAVPSLQALFAGAPFDVVGVVTAPDRPAGRGRKLRPSPVKQAAQDAGMPVFQPKSLRSESAVERLAAWAPDVIVVAAFGQILRPNVLELPPAGCVNVHASLLPRWRGAAPIHAAIRAGDDVSGVTIMQMDPGMDTGPIIGQREVRLEPRETAATLHDKLARLGAAALVELLPGYLRGETIPQPQPDNPELVTLAPMLKKSDGEIDWTQTAVAIDRLVRAYDPWPGTFTTWCSQTLKVLKARPEGITDMVRPGLVVETRSGGAAVGTGKGFLVLRQVQLAGRQAMDIPDFLNGQPDFIGSVLGDDCD